MFCRGSSNDKVVDFLFLLETMRNVFFDLNLSFEVELSPLSYLFAGIHGRMIYYSFINLYSIYRIIYYFFYQCVYVYVKVWFSYGVFFWFKCRCLFHL